LTQAADTRRRGAGFVDMKLEVVVVPVADVDRAKDFYKALGWREDAELAARGAEMSEVFHDAGGVFHHAGTVGRVAGPDSDHKSYGSFDSFSDPDGNGWLIQEITTRLPGR
jgi:catechol 2,3-dioxygenase-like lactoylglutathione lyase family enzyme